jgi:hypothetical protein
MMKYFSLAAAASLALSAWSTPAFAGGNVHWSVSVGGPVYVQPGVVYQQPQVDYGPYGRPPSAFPSPPVYYYPAPSYYVAPTQAYPIAPPPVIYYQSPAPRPHHHQHHHHHHRGYHYGDGRAALRR